MNFTRNFRSSKRGIGTVFGMVFFLLIVMIVFASFMIILSQNTGLEQTTMQAKQLDLDRYTELTTVSISDPEIAVLNQVVYVGCNIMNNGTLPTQLVRLWIKDVTKNTVDSIIMTPSITLQPGHSVAYFNSAYVANASFSDQIAFWFITTRGNTISAYPSTYQLNSIISSGAFPGVTDINSTYTGEIYHPLQLSLTTTRQNQLIYVVVSYDDENTLYTPTSTPSLIWTNRSQSLDTDYGYFMDGDSTLETFYAIKPSPGPLQINIQSTADELSDYYCSALAFAISDVNTTAPFDGSAQTTVAKSTMPQDTITTHYSNELIIGAVSIDSLNPQINPGAGFAEIMPVQSSYGATGEPDAQPRSVWSEWTITNTPITNLPVNCTFTSTKNWAIIVDAVRLITIPPTTPVSLSPNSGPIGQSITVSGNGFAANSPLLAIFDGSPIPFSATTDSNGAIPSNAKFIVPLGSTAGNKTVTIVDRSFNYANTTFLVTPPSIAVSPTSGPIGTVVTVTGSNFVSSSTITINFDGNSMTTNPFNITSSLTGSFSATFNTSSDSAGVKQISATDGFNSPSANFAVTPSITLNPTNGPIGSSVNVVGYGFAAFQPVGITFAGSTATTIPASVTTDNMGFLNASFIVQIGQTAGGKTVAATDALSNTASATFTVTQSISLSPTIGNIGSTVTASGSGFAPNSLLTAKFAGSTVTLSGTLRTDAYGSFTGANFTVPTWNSNWVTGNVQTASITDAASNSGSAAYTVNTVSQSITVAMLNSAPISTVTVSGGNPNPNTFAADGNSHSVTIFAGASFTLSLSNPVNARDGFIVSNAFSANSISYTASATPITVSGVEQVQNTFSIPSFIGGNPAGGDSLVLTGTYLGTGSYNIATLTSSGWSASAWSDYNSAAAFPANTVMSGSNQQWAINGVYTTSALTTGGNTYSKSYYHQYSFQLDYAISGGGAPTACTLRATQFGSTYTPTLGTAIATYWLDNGQSWNVTNPLGGSGSNERWYSRQTISGTVSASSPTTAGTGTLAFTYYHQYLMTVSGGNGVTYGTVSPTSDNWYDSTQSTTVSSNGIYSRVSGSGQRVSSWQIDFGTVNNIATTGPVTTTTISMSDAHTVTFASVTQYLLTNSFDSGAVNSITSSLTGDSWYDSGTTVNVVLNNLWGSSARNNLFSYTIDSTTTPVTRSNTGTVTVTGILMNAAHSISDVAKIQYFLTVTGGNSVTFGTASPTGDQWYDSGTSTTVSSNWVWSTSGGSRSALSNWQLDGTNQGPTRHNTGALTTSSISMSASHAVNFVGVTQNLLTVSGGNGVTYGTVSPTSDNWYDSTQSTTVSSNGIYSRVSGSGLRVASWNVDGASNTNVGTVGTVTTSSVSMSTPHTVSFNQVTQYQVTLDSGATSALASITSPTITGDNYWYDSNTPVTLTLNGVFGRGSGTGSRITGFRINGGSNTPETTVGSFVVLNAVPISSVEAITTSTVTQYQITLDSTSTSALNSLTGPTISNDNYWYDSSTAVSIILNGVWGQGGGMGTRLTGYAINGGSNNPTSTTGTLTVFSGAISNHEFVTATSVTQYQVTFSQTGVDSSAGSNTVLTVGSTNYAYNYLPSSLYVDNGTPFSWVSPVSGSVGKQFVQNGSSGSSPITAAGTYSATYKTQYYQTVTSSPATGSGYITVDSVARATPYQAWWDSGSSHTIAANSPVTIVSGQSRRVYSSWSDSGAQSHSVSPTTVTTYAVSFQLQYYFSVSSARDTPTGQGWYNAGSSVSSTVTRPVSGGTGIQYETTGWIGTGSLSSGGSAGSSSTGSFTINTYSTCTWNWKTQYVYVPLTITNTQSSATPSTFQQKITWNPSSYMNYEASNLGNIRFYSDSDLTTPLNAWLETCTPSLSNTATSATAWIKLIDSITENGGTMTIYMAFLPTTTNFDGNYWGDAPNLSGTYGAYDNGDSVFNAYFNGNTPTSSFSVDSGYTIVHANGISGPGATTINAIRVRGYNGGDAVFSFNTPLGNTALIAESSFSSTNQGTDTGAIGLVNRATASSVTNAISANIGYGSAYFNQDYMGSGTLTSNVNPHGTSTSSWLYATLTYTGSTSPWSASIAPQLYSSTGGYSGTISTNPLRYENNLYLGQLSSTSSSYPIDIYYNFARARVYPPGNVMPSISFGSLSF